MSLSNLILNKDLKTNICFIHVPKCAGTSVNKAIYKNYGFLYRKLKKKYFYHFSAMAATKGAKLLNEDIFEYREKILLYFLSKGTYSFISGHFPFSELAMNHFGDHWDFMTILRNPVDRWFSHYFFNRRKKDDHFKTDSSLEEFVDSAEGRDLGTLYHKIFYGKKVLDRDKIDQAYNVVIENINKFRCVGITEHMNIFCRDFNKAFGMKLSIRTVNKSPFSKNEQSAMISKSIRQKVENICEPDLKIYDYFYSKIVSGN